ncbi:toll/interleukin-1 receptor domain-containing protein [Janibacter melonis]|uniref:toll/interleukin-1 receptor domain-containing protein n=1 Tax=Janibacter melonis TaxID=262209 RepID=UPI002094F8AC|nr:toll/interleukin-1 receptor domain-containing protein [Janibacter melonis]
MANFNASQFNAQVRAAQRRAEQQFKREVDRVNRANKKAVDDHNRKAEAHNRRVIADYNRQVDAHNRKADAHNRRVIDDLHRQLSAGRSTTVRYTEPERRLADRVHDAVAQVDPKEYDTFLSYARIDGSEVAAELRAALEDLGVAVWFDHVSIQAGKSQSLQMDQGLRKARSGIALLTPAYLAGRFWTERELGALLGKSTLIPVLHNVTFKDVQEYSGILPDLAGFTTATDSVNDIARKIAAAVTVDN